MKHGATVVTVILLAAAAAGDARPIGEDQEKEQVRRPAPRRDFESHPPKSSHHEGLHRGLERNLEADFRTGIGDDEDRGHADKDDDE